MKRWKLYAGLVVSLLYCSALIAGENWQPAADKNAVLTFGDVRFTVLTPALLRLEHSPQRDFRDQASLVVVNRHLPVPKFSHGVKDNTLTLTTEQLTLTYQLGSGAFNADNLRIVSKTAAPSINWRPGDLNSENLGGTARTLDGMNGGIDWQGNSLDLGEGLVSKAGWFLLDDSASHTLAGVNKDNQWAWVETPAVQSDEAVSIQDWYFFGHGRNFKQALNDYTRIAGKIPLPPRYAFGYWWSRYWVYSDQELRELMTQMREYDIPIDVLVIDMDWHLTHGGLKDIKNPQRDPFGELLGWTGYTWNEALFPQPEAFLDWTETFHLKTALNLHPASGIPPMESQYQTFADQYGFDTGKQAYIPYRMAEQKWAQTYVDTILRPLEKQGVDFWWLDWQQFPESKVVEGLSNTWWLNYVFFTDMARQNKRPLLFHRWGGMGNHRYQIGFSGDDKISWESLQYQTYFTATASNVGYGYWSHDIGGHASGELDKDAELYHRWLQFGVFSPILRTHSAKISSIERRFWQYPERFEAMRELVKLRYHLNPYIYNAARVAHDTGVSIVRPMYYDSPYTEQAYQAQYQYMFGDDMLVAPVAKPVDSESLLAAQQVWLPEGQWYEWQTGTTLEGGKTLTRNYAEWETPVFIKAGAIIPMYDDIDHLQTQYSRINLMIAPGQQGQSRLYEDQGNRLDYQHGKYATTTIQQNMDANGIQRVSIAAREGAYEGMLPAREFTLTLPSTFPLRQVQLNGKTLPTSAIHYDAQNLANVITLPELPADQPLTVKITHADQTLTHGAMLNGKIGQFKRLSKAVAALKIEVARSSWWATLPDLILGAEQTPTRISYLPQQTMQLIEQFDADYPRMFPLIRAHKDARPEVAERYIRFLSE